MVHPVPKIRKFGIIMARQDLKSRIWENHGAPGTKIRKFGIIMAQPGLKIRKFGITMV
jgi:hypothetical protein